MGKQRSPWRLTCSWIPKGETVLYQSLDKKVFLRALKSMGKLKSRAFDGSRCTTENAAVLLLACWEELDESEIAAEWDYREDVHHHEVIDDNDNEFVLVGGSEEEDLDGKPAPGNFPPVSSR
jgi:hypothetical protein